MAQNVNCIYVELSRQHPDFGKVAKALASRGFSFYCYNKWSLQRVDFDPTGETADQPDEFNVYTCTLNLEASEIDIVSYIIDNDFHHNGCIKHYCINIIAIE